MSRKRAMYLVSDSKIKKKYNKFFIFMCDESHYEFDLSTHAIYKDHDWIEVLKIDGTEEDCFSINNVMRVRFVHTEKKSNIESVSLKSVPPNDAA